MNLYSKNGSYPIPLPFGDWGRDADGRKTWFEPLESATPDELASTGWKAAPAAPAYDSAVERLEWSSDLGRWETLLLTADEQASVAAAITLRWKQAIDAERDRRLAEGFDFDFQDARGVHRIGTTRTDMDKWAEVSEISSAALNLSLPALQIGITTDTGRTYVTATEWQQVLLFGAGGHRQPIYNGAFALRALPPFSVDPGDDIHWRV